MFRIAIVISLATTMSLLAVADTTAGFPDHVRKTRTKCVLPDYTYGRDRDVASASELTLPAIEEAVVFQSTAVDQSSEPVPGGRAPWTGLAPPPKGSVLARPGFSPTTPAGNGALLRNLPAFQDTRDKVPTSRPIVLRRKRFNLRVSTVALDAVKLDNVALSVDELGRLNSTGTLLHTGGPTGDLLGSRVIVRLQALAGSADGSGPILWQTAKTTWLPKGQPRTDSLIHSAADPQLQAVFDQVAQFRLILEYQRDR